MHHNIPAVGHPGIVSVRLLRLPVLQDVGGIGRQGDVVSVKRGKMRHELYPGGDAAYATPENVAKYALVRRAGHWLGVILLVWKARARSPWRLSSRLAAEPGSAALRPHDVLYP
jgi:hypothetical protein